jgi:penicillin-binding protein-related factor A (putative recombinase)
MGTQRDTRQARALRRGFAASAKTRDLTELKFKEIGFMLSDSKTTIVSFVLFTDEQNKEYYASIDLADIKKMLREVKQAKNAVAINSITSNPGHAFAPIN